MASTSFGVLITGDSRGAVKAIDLTAAEIKKLEGATAKATAKIKSDSASAAGGFGSMATSAAKMGAAVGAAGIALSGLLLRQVIKETAESEYAIAQLNSTLQATGGAAGKSSEELQRTANALQKTTTYSDEAVIGVESLLLKFKEIKGDTFDRATKNVLDFATAMKIDVNSAAKLVGKALEEPEKGMLKLARAGVVFTESEKDTIKAMMEMGDTAGAQNFILAEMEERFKGSAEAARGTLGGALEGLKNNFGELFEVSSEASGGMVDNINKLSETLADPQIKASIDAIVGGLISATDWAIKATAALAWFFGMETKQNLVEIGEEIDEVSKKLVDAQSGRTVNPAAVEGLKKQLDELNKAYDKEVKAIMGSTAAKTVNTAATEKGTAATTKSNNVVLISEATQKKQAKALKEAAAEATTLADAHKKMQDRIDAATKSINSSHAELDKMNAKTEEYIASLKFETEQLGKSARQQEIDSAVREAGTAITKKQADAIREAAGAHYDAAAAAEVLANKAEAANAAWIDARSTLSDFFFEFAKDGNDAFDTIVDSFKAMLTKMAAEAAANTIFSALGIGPASGGLMSLFGSGTGATAATAAGSSGSSGSMGLLAGGLWGALALGAVRTADDLENGMYGPGDVLTGNSLHIKYGDSLGGLGKYLFPDTSKLDFLGIGDKINKYFGQDNDGKNTGKARFDLATGLITGEGSGKTFDPANVAAAETLANTLKEFSVAIGGSSFAGSIKIDSRDGIGFGGKKYGQDTEAFFKDAIRSVVEGATNLGDNLKALLISFDGTTEELINFSGAIIGLNEQSQLNTVISAIEDFTAASQTMSEAFYNNTDALNEQISAYDGTAESAMLLNESLAENKIAAYEFAMAIISIGKAIAEQSEAQAKSIRESVLTEEELFKARQRERDTLSASLSSLVDPAEIEKTSQRILELNQQLFSSLTEEQQKAGAEAYATFAENTNNIAQEVLRNALIDVEKSQDDINTKIANMLGGAANKQQQAADTMLRAANLLQSAVSNIPRGGFTAGGGEVAA